MNNTCTYGAMYHIVIGGSHDGGLRALMIVFAVYV